MSTTLTDDEARALGERWIAAGGGWPAGSRGYNPAGKTWFRVYGQTIIGHLITFEGRDARQADLMGCWPDLRDPATRGACLEVVRERRRDPATHIRPPVNGSGWRAFDGTCAPVRNAQGAPVEADGEAACLVAALEAAPR